MKVLSLFDGISCTRQALYNLGLPVSYYGSSEIDKYANATSQKNWPGLDITRLGDVRDIVNHEPVDLIIAGSPCQGFSLQGKQLGMEDPRSMLVNEVFRILEETPHKYFLLENTRMKKECLDYISERIGVQPVLINSKEVVPQSRPRYYWTNIPQFGIEPVDYNIRDFILTPEGVPGTARKGPPRHVVETEVFGCLTATYYKGVRADGRPQVVTKTGEFDEVKAYNRALTPEECELIQGLPVGYTEGCSKTQRYIQLGNGFTIPIIEQLLMGVL